MAFSRLRRASVVLGSALLASCAVAVGVDDYDSNPDGGKADTGRADTAISPTDTGKDTGSVDTGIDTGSVDTGTEDTGSVDTSVDTGEPDTGTVDTGLLDTGVKDSGLLDTGVKDTGTPDTGVKDTGTDTGSDVGAETTAETGGDSGATDVGDTGPVTCHPVVNEVQVAGASAADEWVEIYNPCPTAFTMTGWKVVYRSATGTSDTLLRDIGALNLPADGYLIFTGAGAPASPSDGLFTAGSGTGALSGSAGGIALKDPSGTVVDSMGYGTTTTNAFVEKEGTTGGPTIVPASGKTLARTPNGRDTNNNAADFKEAVPTPRAKN